MLWQALMAVRDLGRLHDIASILIRYGFGDLVRRMGLADALERAGRALHWHETEELAHLERSPGCGERWRRWGRPSSSSARCSPPASTCSSRNGSSNSASCRTMRRPLPGIFEVLLASLYIMQARVTETTLLQDRPEILIQPPVGAVRFMEFDRAEEIIEIGYRNAVEQLANLAPRTLKKQ
jgi:predicted acylesterase/phospholipase RssA